MVIEWIVKKSEKCTSSCLHPAGKRLQNPQNQCDQLRSEKSVRSEARERVGAALILARAPPRLK